MSDYEQNLPNHVKIMVDKVGEGDLASAADAFDAAVHIDNYRSNIAQNSFQPPEPSPGEDTGITGDPAEVPEE